MSLRITSINVNGIRAAERKGFFQWLEQHKADIVCLQEIKISEPDLTMSHIQPTPNDQGYFMHANKKGYSGVGLYIKHQHLDQLEHIQKGFNCPEFDAEGRIILAKFPNLTVVSAYLPSGSSKEERQIAKFRFLKDFTPWIQNMMDDHKKSGHEYIICGDWNIAHNNIDIKNWKGNLKNSGFTPEERAWLTSVFDEIGFVDVFRTLYPEKEQYTWWSNRGRAWANNVGWRIDYQIATPGIAKTAKKAFVYMDERFSDHAPLCIDYEFNLEF